MSNVIELIRRVKISLKDNCSRWQLFEERRILSILFLLASISISVPSCTAPQRNDLKPTLIPTIIPTIQQTAQPNQPSLPSDWTSRWLQGIPCSLPCWEGITLGKTTQTEAVEILRQNPLFNTIRTGTLPDSESITWKWPNGEQGGATYSPKQPPNQPIYHIQPKYYHVAYNLRQVIQALGAPSHVIATGIRSPYEANKITYWTWVVYLSQGVVLNTSGKYLDEDKLFEGLDFFTPT